MKSLLASESLEHYRTPTLKIVGPRVLSTEDPGRDRVQGKVGTRILKRLLGIRHLCLEGMRLKLEILRLQNLRCKPFKFDPRGSRYKLTFDVSSSHYSKPFRHMSSSFKTTLHQSHLLPPIPIIVGIL